MSDVAVERTTQTIPVQEVPKLRLKWIALAGLAGCLVLGAARYGYEWWSVGRFIESTDDAYVGGNVTPISPHVAGFVAEILVATNDHVRAGQPLIRLDDRDFRAAVDRATAVVAARQAALASLEARDRLQQSTIGRAKADLDARTAEATFAKQDDLRYRQLAQSSAGSMQNAEKALAANQVAQSAVVSAGAALDAAKQQLAVFDADIAEARAAVTQAEADLQTATLNLGYTEIRSPIDGYIGNRAAQVGAYVSGGAYLLTVVPAHELWVDANFKEDQLERMAPGQPATVVADTLPDHIFHGRVLSVAPGAGAIFSVIPPENATGNFTKIVQRVAVRVALDPDDEKLGALRPGLSTTASVDIRSDSGRTQ
jgi:membrane fusion protein, multidrug efflux system